MNAVPTDFMQECQTFQRQMRRRDKRCPKFVPLAIWRRLVWRGVSYRVPNDDLYRRHYIMPCWDPDHVYLLYISVWNSARVWRKYIIENNQLIEVEEE